MFHSNTPQSVLDAPARTVEPVVIHEGATRMERRHGLTTKVEDIRLYLATKNAPHVRTEPRRGRKVKRGAK